MASVPLVRQPRAPLGLVTYKLQGRLWLGRGIHSRVVDRRSDPLVGVYVYKGVHEEIASPRRPTQTNGASRAGFTRPLNVRAVMQLWVPRHKDWEKRRDRHLPRTHLTASASVSQSFRCQTGGRSLQ